ncbi:aldehyde dehydrogenase x [Dermatophagoides farinae]|nr:aldehyde dehydrogenase X, mitochondrial-like [Dermatophagoides farinae]KAH7643095.1 aldehyde dehydrogenase x [Dermatophagoides farinae]
MTTPSIDIKFTKIFINNEWHNSLSGKTFTTVNPTTEETLAYVQEADEGDVDLAVKAATDAFRPSSQWRRMNASERGHLLQKLADLMERDKDYLARLEVYDNGKPLADAIGDIDASIGTFRYYAGWADKIHGKVIPADGKVFSYTKIEPVGVCGQIIPWNYPLLMVAWKFAPALACGCTIVLKPSEFTPLSALYVGSLIVEAGFPAGVVNIVPGYGSTAGHALVRHPSVDKIAFTGSTQTGQLIMKTAAETCKRVSLELGGKSPLVVTESCKDLKKAAEIAHQACFANMGQCCCAGTRTFVHESIYEEFVKMAAEIARNRKAGDPFDSKTVQGPQINLIQTEKILGLIESGKKEGARCVTGGKRMAGKGYFIEPTVFADVTDEMRIAREEIFGPVQQIIRYSSMDEVIERCNDTRYGLAAGIITENFEEIIKFTENVRAGTVWVNCYDEGGTQIPFGGYKQSGIGRELGEDGLHPYCEIKSVIIRK